MPVSVKRLILLALTFAAGVGLLGLLFYQSTRFGNFDARLTADLLAPEGSAAGSVAHFASDGGGGLPLLAGLLLVIALGVLWRRPWQLAVGIAVFFLANITTQLMKLVLAHPDLQGALGATYPVEIDYPSGHTTAAFALGFALWLTAPPKSRGWAGAVGLLYGTAVGIGVVVAGWHFVSDVFGAVMVVGFWSALALAGLVAAGREAPSDWWRPIPEDRRGPMEPGQRS
jgi:membrane-associated phospholipid phosphatase